MAPTKAVTLPVIPLAKDTVLLPGIVLRIPVAGNRSDIPALLSTIYSRAASRSFSQRLENVNVACVPLNSPFLTRTGQRMIQQDERNPKLKERHDVHPGSATKDDLFGYGVAAKISGVEGKGTGEFALLVEGIARVKIDRIKQERPFFEAEVTYQIDDGKYMLIQTIYNLLIYCSHLSGRHRNPRTLCTFKTIIPRALNVITTIFSPTSKQWFFRLIPNTSSTS